MATLKPMSQEALDAEAAFAKKIFGQRAELNEKARRAISSNAGSRQVTIRLSESKGLPYQTYMKMLLHEALNRGSR